MRTAGGGSPWPAEFFQPIKPNPSRAAHLHYLHCNYQRCNRTCATCVLTASGISRWSSTAPADEMAAWAAPLSAQGAVLAPPCRMMRLSPEQVEGANRLVLWVSGRMGWCMCGVGADVQDDCGRRLRVNRNKEAKHLGLHGHRRAGQWPVACIAARQHSETCRGMTLRGDRRHSIPCHADLPRHAQ